MMMMITTTKMTIDPTPKLPSETRTTSHPTTILCDQFSRKEPKLNHCKTKNKNKTNITNRVNLITIIIV